MVFGPVTEGKFKDWRQVVFLSPDADLLSYLEYCISEKNLAASKRDSWLQQVIEERCLDIYYIFWDTPS